MKKTVEDFIKQAERYGAKNYAPLPVVLTKGDGIYLYDINGKKYFDMLSAYSAVNQGHNNKKLIKAAIKQLKRLYLTSRAFHNDKMGDFLQKIAEITGYEKVIPMNTGAEGVETAIKIMRKYAYEKKGIKKDCGEIIVAENNFHGRTTTIVGFSTDKTTKEGFGPYTPGFKIIKYNDIGELEKAINENTIGYLVEPIQGEAGVIIPDDDYFRKVREICDKYGILLAFDEIQTGLGRTGKLFCFQHYRIKPDILILGKALSGGLYPISCVATSAEIMNVLTPGTHGSTFGGNPLASAIGIASLEYIIKNKLPENAEKLGKYFIEKLKKEIMDDDIKEIRGKGLLIAVEMKKPVARKVCIELMRVGILAKDTHEKTIRFAPPLIIKKKQIDKAVMKIKKGFENFRKCSCT